MSAIVPGPQKFSTTQINNSGQFQQYPDDKNNELKIGTGWDNTGVAVEVNDDLTTHNSNNSQNTGFLFNGSKETDIAFKAVQVGEEVFSVDGSGNVKIQGNLTVQGTVVGNYDHPIEYRTAWEFIPFICLLLVVAGIQMRRSNKLFRKLQMMERNMLKETNLPRNETPL